MALDNSGAFIFQAKRLIVGPFYIRKRFVFPAGGIC